MIGFRAEGWVPAERYEEAMALSKKMKGPDWRWLSQRRNGLRSRRTGPWTT